MKRPAYKIKTERLLLSCYEPNDVYLLKETIDNNLEHLKEWLPWAKEEPQEIKDKINIIRKFRADFDLDNQYIYGIFTPDHKKLIGVVGLMPMIGENALEIGYWLGKEYTKKGYMSEAVKAVLKVGFELLELTRIEIHCDLLNERSKKVPEKLGFTHEATIRVNELDENNEHKKHMIFVLFKDEYEKMELKNIEIEAYDILNQRLI